MSLRSVLYTAAILKKELVTSVRGCVFLVVYDHGHGADHSIHKTHNGAKEFIYSCVEEYRHSFVDSNGPYSDASTEELAEDWWNVTGGCESFNIIELSLEE